MHRQHAVEITQLATGLFRSSVMNLLFYYFLRIDVIRAAQTTLRVKFSYVMIALTIMGCIVMVIRGKQVSINF